MNTKTKAEAAVTAEQVDQRLPRMFFVRRGDVMRAFGLNDEQMKSLTVMETEDLAAEAKAALARQGKFVAEYPTGKQAKFVRSLVVTAAWAWEGRR